MIKPIKLLFLLFLLVSYACTNSVYRGRDVLGAEEFVLDSYQILEDKAYQGPVTYSIKNISPQKNITVCADKLQLLKVLSVVSKKANLSKSYLIRNSQLLPTDLFDLIENQNMKQNIVLKRNDKIYIMENSYIMVLGDVARECLIDVPNGFIPLKQALSHVEGILSSGSKAYIQILRGNILQPKIYTLHLRYVMDLPEHSMLLIPGDIVCIVTKLITPWSFTAYKLPSNFIAFDLLRKKASLEVTIE